MEMSWGGIRKGNKRYRVPPRQHKRKVGAKIRLPQTKTTQLRTITFKLSSKVWPIVQKVPAGKITKIIYAEEPQYPPFSDHQRCHHQAQTQTLLVLAQKHLSMRKKNP